MSDHIPPSEVTRIVPVEHVDLTRPPPSLTPAHSRNPPPIYVIVNSASQSTNNQPMPTQWPYDGINANRTFQARGESTQFRQAQENDVMPSGFRPRINAHPLENPHDNDFGYDGINANRTFQARGESTQFRQAQENDVMPSGFRARINAHPLENPHDNDFGYDGINANRTFQARGESTQFRQAQENDVIPSGFRPRINAHPLENPHDNDFGYDGINVSRTFQARGESTQFRQAQENDVMPSGFRPRINAHPLENPRDNDFGYDGINANRAFQARGESTQLRRAQENDVMPSGFRARINAHPLESPRDNDFGYDGINANRTSQARGESTQFRQAQENDGFRTRQHPYDFGGRTARVVNIVEVPESTQPLAIGWKQDATRPTTNPEPLRRSARRAAAAAAAASSKEADVERGQSSEGSSRGNRAQRQGHNLVADQQDHSDDDAQPINSRENNNSDSDSSQRDDLGRWMDGEDDVSSDFEPKVKISKANQQKKVHALKKKKNNAHQFNSDDEAGPSKRPTTAGRGRSDSDSDFETEARKQQQRAPSKSKPKSLTLKTKASGEVKRKGKQQQQEQQQAEPKFTGALHEADHGAISNGQQSEAITISDSEGSVGHPAAELFPIEAELLTDDFIIPSDSLSESWCTICFEDYNRESFLGILYPCHCFQFCYVCAVRISESLDPSCPRCRKEIWKVESQPFTKSLLADDCF